MVATIWKCRFRRRRRMSIVNADFGGTRVFPDEFKSKSCLIVAAARRKPTRTWSLQTKGRGPLGRRRLLARGCSQTRRVQACPLPPPSTTFTHSFFSPPILSCQSLLRPCLRLSPHPATATATVPATVTAAALTRRLRLVRPHLLFLLYSLYSEHHSVSTCVGLSHLNRIIKLAQHPAVCARR